MQCGVQQRRMDAEPLPVLGALGQHHLCEEYPPYRHTEHSPWNTGPYS